jgi:hypothetical protein
MKMRKILPIVILAVGSLFLLSGCDALLDAIFAKNQMTIDVRVSIPPYPLVSAYYYDWLYGVGTVTLSVHDLTSGSVTVVTSGRTGYDSSSSHFYFPFTKLANDTFMITATYTSGYYGSPAPTSVFFDPSGYGMTSITLPYSNGGDSTGHSVNLYMYF